MNTHDSDSTPGWRFCHGHWVPAGGPELLEPGGLPPTGSLPCKGHNLLGRKELNSALLWDFTYVTSGN
jgi:hypothetical protein